MLDNEFPPLGGGTGTVNRAILQRVASVPHLEIDLVTAALGSRYEEEVFADRIKLFKVPVNNQDLHHSSNRELITYAYRAWRVAQRLHRARHYELCMAWSAVPAGWVALMVSRQHGLKYFVRVSGPDIPGFEERYTWLYPLLKPLIVATWRRARVVVAKCHQEAEMIRRVDPYARIEIIPNGVDLTAFRVADPVPEHGPLKLLSVARLIERKGQRHLIQALQHLAHDGIDATLDLIGTGDELTAYQSLARSLDVADRVRFLGYVPREEIAAHYAQAHVFVLASYNEGMSVATLEAMASGLPVIVTHVGGADELVEEGVNGLTFNWADVDMLVEHIKRLAHDRSLARIMGAASRARAQTFSWERAADAYLNLFDHLLAN